MSEVHGEIHISEEEYEQRIIRYRHALSNARSEIENILDDYQRSAGRNVIYSHPDRIKTLPSLLEKCNRKHLSPDKIDDIAGAKIVVLFEDDIEPICELLRNAFVIKEEDDYLSNPKDNGYRAVHLTAVIKTTVDGRQVQVPVEIQVKTVLSDALWSMEHVVRYKKGTPDPRASAIIRAASSRIDELSKIMLEFRDYETKVDAKPKN